MVTIREGRAAHVECILAGWGKIKGVGPDPEGRPVKGARVAVSPFTGPTQLSGEDGAFEVIRPRPAGAGNATVSYLVGRSVRGNLAAVQQIGEGTIVIQTSKTDVKQYDDWPRANQIDFRVQTVEGDFEAKEPSWGIKALPWLILADKERRVVAEGFEMGSLSDKLDSVIGK